MEDDKRRHGGDRVCACDGRLCVHVAFGEDDAVRGRVFFGEGGVVWCHGVAGAAPGGVEVDDGEGVGGDEGGEVGGGCEIRWGGHCVPVFRVYGKLVGGGAGELESLRSTALLLAAFDYVD